MIPVVAYFWRVLLSTSFIDFMTLQAPNLLKPERHEFAKPVVLAPVTL